MSIGVDRHIALSSGAWSMKTACLRERIRSGLADGSVIEAAVSATADVRVRPGRVLGEGCLELNLPVLGLPVRVLPIAVLVDRQQSSRRQRGPVPGPVPDAPPNDEATPPVVLRPRNALDRHLHELLKGSPRRLHKGNGPGKRSSARPCIPRISQTLRDSCA
ncbi:hypothetical protein GCM10010273_09980 [Streptomyces lavendulocolor]